MLTTTLKDIRAARPCEDGWQDPLNHMDVSPTEAKSGDHKVNLDVVLDAVGLKDTLWVIGNVLHEDMLLRLFAADCAERVLHLFENEYPDDDRPRRAIEAARDPDATKEQLAVARAAAEAAARAAGWDSVGGAARAARAAARAAGRDAARDAAWAAVGGAARAAGWDAGRDAARDAAWAAAWADQKSRLLQYITHGESAAEMEWK